MIVPFSPALQVDFAFVRNTDRSTQNLNAFIFGPAATVVRWDEADLRDNGLLGSTTKLVCCWRVSTRRHTLT